MLVRRSGGIGRRAGFRCLWQQCRVGSSPISCMKKEEGLGIRLDLLLFACRSVTWSPGFKFSLFHVFSNIHRHVLHRLHRLTKYLLLIIFCTKSQIPLFFKKIIQIKYFDIWITELASKKSLRRLFCQKKKPLKIKGFLCGRWDLNPHERNAHKILSLARLPVPTLPHIAFHG